MFEISLLTLINVVYASSRWLSAHSQDKTYNIPPSPNLTYSTLMTPWLLLPLLVSTADSSSLEGRIHPKTWFECPVFFAWIYATVPPLDFGGVRNASLNQEHFVSFQFFCGEN
jgi:hypothetical protein